MGAAGWDGWMGEVHTVVRGGRTAAPVQRPAASSQPSHAPPACRPQVTQAGLALLEDGSKVGACLVVLVDGGWVEPQRTRFKSGAGVLLGRVAAPGWIPAKRSQRGSTDLPPHACCPAACPYHAVAKPASAEAARVDPALLAWATAALPADSTRVVEVHKLSNDFRAATRIVRRPLPAVLPPGHVLIRCGLEMGCACLEPRAARVA